MKPIDGEELLYRCIGAGDVTWDGDGWRLSSQAFNDREMKPSVDRQCLRPDPNDTKREPTDGVGQLLTADIHANVKLLKNPNAKPPEAHEHYAVHVMPRPIEQPPNPAHAQIEAAPEIASGSHFKKLKDALCRLTERRAWVVMPSKDAQ